MHLTVRLICLGLLVEWSVQDYPFRNVSLSWDARVDDLVDRLSIEEIALQMARGGAGVNGPSPNISRLGIGHYQWDTECLHGSVGHNATAFPQSIGLAATWSYDVVYRMARATGEEVRAIHNTNTKDNRYPDLSGLGCFAPVINIMRDPRWGRNQESYGEDPFLTGMMATAFVKGIQGDHPRYIRANAGCKHFAAYAGPEDIPISRVRFSANVTERDLRTTFLPAFRYCVEAGTYGIMCSYNSVNGVPACANTKTLSDVLRDEWGFKGYVVSDMEAIEMIISQHKYYNNSIDTAAGSVNAGVNLELAGRTTKTGVFTYIAQAVKDGKLNASLVKQRVKPLFYTRMRLGEFDPPQMNPYSTINTSVIEEQAHRDLAVEAAMKSFVLLKNDGLLPLKKTQYNSISIIGPLIDDNDHIEGSYTAKPDNKFITTVHEGLQTLGKTVKNATGCLDDTQCTKYDSHSIKMAVQDVDIIFICLGLGPAIEGEGHDRSDIQFPGQQSQLLVDAVNNSGSAKIVLIMFNAGPVNISWADHNPRVSAILAAFYPGQGAGVALRNVLTSSNKAQFGRLPYTWFYSADQVPPIVNYTMEGRTYRYLNSEPLYPFGYGLTYTSFEYIELMYNSVVNAGDKMFGSVKLVNAGSCTGDEIIQVYVSWVNASVPVPQIQLVNFTRVTIPQGGIVEFQFSISPENMAVFTENKGWVLEEGDIRLFVGGEQPGQFKRAATDYMDGTFSVNGTKILGFY